MSGHPTTPCTHLSKLTRWTNTARTNTAHTCLPIKPATRLIHQTIIYRHTLTLTKPSPFTRGLDSRTLSVPLIQLPPLLSTLPTSSSLSLTFYSYPPSLLDILYQSISIYISPDLSISTQYLYCQTSTASQHLGMKASRQREETEWPALTACRKPSMNDYLYTPLL